jgi:hypothetical protein
MVLKLGSKVVLLPPAQLYLLWAGYLNKEKEWLRKELRLPMQFPFSINGLHTNIAS